jgi:ATP-dependent exoDNAse (exonuclease V) beta subunit
VIIAEQATREGTYVALTRARQITQIYSVRQPDTTDDLQALAERVSRTEPEMPSIATPLAHEHTITSESIQASQEGNAIESTPEPRSHEADREQSMWRAPARQWPGRSDRTPPPSLDLEQEPTWTMGW